MSRNLELLPLKKVGIYWVLATSLVVLPVLFSLINWSVKMDCPGIPAGITAVNIIVLM